MRTWTKLLIVMTCLAPQLSFGLDEAMLASYSRKVVEQICSGKRDWLRCYGVDPLTCEGVNGVIVEQCVQEHIYRRVQPVRDQSEVREVSEQLYTCIRTSFHKKFDAQKKDTPECRSVE